MTASSDLHEPVADVSAAAACEAFEPVSWANGDTDETIRQIREHNAVWLELCSPPDARAAHSEEE